MDNVVSFTGRGKPPPPQQQREPKVLMLGASHGGIRRPCTIITAYKEEIENVGIDYKVQWELIAVRDRVVCTYRTTPEFPPKTAAAND